MILVTILIWISAIIATSWIKNPGLKKATRILITWFLTPLFLYQLLPFELSWKIDYLEIYITLVLFFTFILLSFLKQRKSYSLNSSEKINRLNYLSAYFMALLLWLDFFYLRGISINTITDNRQILETLGPSPITYLWIFGSSLSLYNLLYWTKGFFWKNQHLIGPLVAYSVPLLISGNRQYVFFIAMFFTYYLFISTKDNTYKILLRIIPAGICLTLVFIGIQFARQDFADGEQMNFIASINNIECTNDFWCNLSPPLTLFFIYAFAYFGNIYHGFTLVFNSNMETPFFSSTATHLYSVIAKIFELPNVPQIQNSTQTAIEGFTGGFGAFWTSMFSSFYLDFNLAGPIILFMTIFAALTMISLIKNQYLSTKYYSFAFALISFGIMYPPTSELFLLILIILLIFRPIFIKISFFYSKRNIINNQQPLMK